jgi:nucleotide-binding universal stress UspA family protein
MNPSKQESRPRLILVAIDDSPASAHAVDMATALAARLSPVELHFVHVVGPIVGVGGLETIPSPSLGELMRTGRELLATTRARFPALSITTHSLFGMPAHEIVQLAKDLETDVIVVGSHNRKTVERWILGSVSEQVVRKAGCAVIVARPKDHGNVPLPEIEPPCPDCLSVQTATDGDRQWCSRHAERHAHGHTHYETPPTFGVGSTFLRPEG